MKAANLVWDSDGASGGTTGGTGTWDTSTALWDNAGSMEDWINAFNIAYFGGTAGVVTVASTVQAGGLVFNTTGYRLTGGTITLAAPTGATSSTIQVDALSSATVESILAGNSGLTKTGNGTLVLTNNANSYTGDTVINAGSLVISNQGQLGVSSTVISVNGIAGTGNPGYTGGQLVVNGVSATGPVTMTREISISGRGPGATNGGAGLISVGNNVFNGDIVLGGPASEGRILATHGTTTFNGGMFLGSGAANLFYGNGNMIANGQISGVDTGGDRFIKTGSLIGTTLWLTNAANDFRQTIRVDSGTIRVSGPSALGALGNSTSTQSLDSNGGFFEILTDVTDFSSKNYRKRGNGGGIFADHDFGSTLLNQNILMNDLLLDANASFQFNARNGYGLTFSPTDGVVNWANGGTGALTNNGNGTLRLNADINRLSETAARVFTITGNGTTILNGNLLQTGTGAVSLTKAGTGVTRILGTSSTATGITSITNGTLDIAAMTSLPSGAVNLGNATTLSGALTYTGSGETSGKAILLNTTTASAFVNSSGTGALILNGPITALTGNKTLFLGGSNAEANEIASALPTAGGVLNINKHGAGIWVLSGANLYTGTTTVAGGILQVKDTFSGSSRNVIADASSLIFNEDTRTRGAGGIFEYLGDGANASSESLGALLGTAGAGTVMVTAGSGGTADLTFSSLGVISPGAGINFVTNTGAAVTVTGATNTNGIVNAQLFFNGADFAASTAGLLGAATYTDETAGVSLAGGNATPFHVYTSDITSQSTATINAGIKFSDDRAFTLGAAQTLTLQNGSATESGALLVTGGSTVTISGGTGISTGGANDLVFRTDALADVLNLNTPILATSTGGWTKLGAGTLVLGAANAGTAVGQVHINEGIVQLAPGGRLGADSMDVRLRQGATLDLNGVNLGSATSATASIDELSGAGNLKNTGAAASLRVGNGGGSSTFTGTITGLIDLTKAGTGTVRVQGEQSYEGVVTLLAGNFDVSTLADYGVASGLGVGSTLAGNAASLVFNGGTLRYIGQEANNFHLAEGTASVSIDRLFTLAGTGTISSFGSAGQNANQGRAANHAALVFNNTGAIAFSSAGNRTLNLRGDSLGDNYMGLQLIDNPNTGTLAISKFDTGLWILGNTGNSYTGITTIGGGALRAQDGTSLPTGSNLLLNGGGGVFQSSGTFIRALGTGAGQVRFNTADQRAGFAASEAPLTVNLSTPGLVWGSSNSSTPGTANFLATGTLYLSSSTSWADTTFANDFEVTAGVDKAVTVTTTSASTTVTLTTGNTTGMSVGQAISGTNIPAGAFIASINSATQVSISVNATAAGTAIAASVSGPGHREIRVDDNGNTGLDYATVSGVISGAGGLGKVGAGLLILGDANTYSGNTTIREGLLTVSSIGAAGATSSSLGTNVGGGFLEIGNPGTTTTANLLYVGPGETTTRQINLVGTANTLRIDSSGSGALILTALANSTATSVNTTGGAKTLDIRGNNTDGNMITSVLANNGGTLTVNKSDGGLWILNPTSANTFTGVLTAAGGTLGLTTAGIGSASQINMSNASIFGYGGDLAINTLVQLNNNTAAVFAGSNNITINNNVQKAAGANDVPAFSNNLENGAVLTINGNFVNLEPGAATRFVNVRGYGSTVWNGSIQNNSGTSLTGWDIRIANDASFTTTGVANTYTGTKTLGQGTFILDKLAPIGPGGQLNFAGGVLTIGPNVAHLTGANAIANNLFLTGDPATVAGTKSFEFSGTTTNNGGDRKFQNSLTGGATLTLSGAVNLSETSSSRTMWFIGGGDTILSGVVQNGSTAPASALRMAGTGSITLTNANTYDGATTIANGTLILSGNGTLDQNSTIVVEGRGVLRLDNSGTNLGDRVNSNSARDLNLDGGTLQFVGHASGSSETFGRLDINRNGLARILVSGGDSALTFSSVNFANTGSSLDLTGVSNPGSNNKVLFTTAPAGAAISNGVLSRVAIGSDFAGYSTTNGVQAFTGYNNTASLVTPVLTDTVNLTAGAAIAASRSINALRLDDAIGYTVGSSSPGATLTLTSGALLATGGGTHTLNVPLLNTGANGAFFQVATGTTLDVNSSLTGAAFTALQGGTINLNTKQFFTSSFNQHAGTMKLAGGLNTIFPNRQAYFLNNGATLDLNGNTQFIGNLTGSGDQPGDGGSLISSSGTGTIVTDNGGSWMGVISGNVNLGRVGGGTLTIGSEQTYTGWTFLTGSTTTLRDNGALSSTSGIDINLSLLALRNNDNLQLQNNNRVNDAAAINLRGGSIDYGGRVHATGGETFGALSALMGANTLTATNGGTGTAGAFASTLVTFASLNRAPGATINFTGSNLGSEGNNSKIVFTDPLNTIGNGVLGAWAIANSSEYAAYNQTNGVGVVGNGGFVGYDATFGSGNITNLGMGSAGALSTTLAAGTTTTGLLRFHGAFTNSLEFTNDTDVLNLEDGGILRSNNNNLSLVGTPSTRGVITAGGTENSGTRELVVYNAAVGTTAFGGGSTTTGSPLVTMTSTAGLAPGMTLTGTGVPAGSTILSVDSATEVTLTQNSTAIAAGTITFTGSTTNMMIHSVIADNGVGNSVQFIKSGAGTLILSGNNTYTGGTVINQGTVNLTGIGTIIPGGGITLTGGILNTSAAGQIDSSNVVTLNGSSSLTLVGNNTLDSLVFNHIGGTANPTVTNNGILTLTNATPIDVASINTVVGVPTVTGFLEFGSGAKTIHVGAIQMNGVVYDETVNRSLNITAAISGSASITKTGAGLLGLGGQSTFTGGLTIADGGLVLYASSTSTVPNGLVAGPLGIGSVTMASGTRLSVDDSSRTVANAFTFSGDPIFGNTGTSLDTLTLNGALTFTSLGTTGLVANVETLYLNVVLGGQIAGMSAVTAVGSGTGANTFSKTGPGNISGINLTGLSNTATINLNGLTNLNTFSLFHDGDGTGSIETINLGAVTWDPANGANISLTIGRAGNGVNYPTPAFKTIVLDSLNSSVLPNGITLANNNGYGLVIQDDIALASGNSWTVNTANTSLQPAGLELTGVISGSSTLTKAGNGILRLGNAGNSFTGTVDITNGTVEGASDAAFGNLANVIQIGSNSLTEGLRISGTFATGRTVHLNGASSGIDVTGANIFTLNNAFTFATPTNNLQKNDLGTLVLSAAQTGWDGNLIVNQGVVRVSDGASFGTTTGNIQLGNVGATLELTGGVTVADNIVINTTNNSSSVGVNGAGAIRSSAGTNTINGSITTATTTTDANARAVSLVADAGATLNLTGGIVLGLGAAGTNRDNWVGLGGDGTINLTTTAISQTGANGIASLSKFGTGTLNIQVANAFNLAQGQNVFIKQGTLSLNGAGTLGTSTLVAPGRVVLNPTAILEINNTAGNVNNRLSGRNLSVSGADINVFGHSGGSSETAGLFTLREGLSKITLDADAGGALNFATGVITRSAQATLLIRADNFGTASAPGVATFTGSSYAYIGQTGNAGTVTKGILPWALGDTDLNGSGIGFVTSDTAASTGTAILRLLTPSEQTTNFATSLANVNLSTMESLSTLTTFNSLRLGSGGGVTLNYTPLALDSGGLLALAGHGGISGFSGVSYITSSANRELILHNNADLTLNIPIAGTTGGLTKSGTGNLTLAAGNSNHGTVMVNDGTLTLGGGDQTILPGRNVWVNEGATLDLNGSTQFVGTLASRLTEVLARNDLFTANSGGNVVNSAASQATLAIGTGETFAGAISGNIAVARATTAGATADWNLYSDNSYTGPTLFNGGRVQLLDFGRLSGTSSIELSNTSFLLTASNASTEGSNITDRVNDAASILVRGGMFQLRNRAALYTTETFGNVTIGEGGSFIDFAAPGSAVNQADAVFASLTRVAGSRGTVRFMNVGGAPSGAMRLFITELNGVVTTNNIGGGLINHLIGGWATHDREFASYIPSQGVGALNTQGFAGYSPNLINNGSATDNIRILLPNAGSTTLLAADRTLNSLNLQAPAASMAGSVLDLGGNTLTLASGGLILSPVSTAALSLSLNVVNGNLTAGTTSDPADLYVHALSWLNSQLDTTGNADVTLGASIVDNSAGGAVSLVLAGNQGRGTLAATNDVFLTGNNTYTGGTWVNSGRIVLNNANANGTSITSTGTGDVTITGGYGSNPGIFTDRNTQIIYGASDQIRNTATVNVMGGAQWNLNNFSQTIAELNFNNHGGTAPNVTTGTGTLTVTGDISAVGQNAGVNAFSTVNGRLNLAAAAAALTVERVEWNGEDLNPLAPNLLINAVVEGTDLIKNGSGLLRLSGANAWTGNFDLQTGGVSLGNNNALSSGSLTIGDGTFLTSTADNRIINNAYTVNGGFALRDAFNLTLAGAGTLTAGDHEISVDLATEILTLSGILGGASGNLNKTGDGILLLSNSNTYGGSTTVSDGILRYGITDAVPTGTALTVLEGALLDITLGGANVTVGSLAGNSATQGGLIYTGATSGTTVFTAGGNNTSTAFGGVLANATGSTLEFVKIGSGTLTLGGANQYNGSTTVADGRLIARSVGGNSPLGTSQSLIMGGGSTAGILQLGDSSAILNHVFTSLASAGTATTSQIVSGNAAMATLTLDLAATSTFAGNIGGGGANEGNLNLIKNGAGDLVISGTGTSTYGGTTTVNGGKLFMDTAGAFAATTAGLTLADGTEFALRGSTLNTVNNYGFAGSGNVITVGSITGATLGFSLDGTGNTRLNVATGQTMTVNGTLTTAVYVNSAPVSLQDYILINGAAANSLHAGGGTFDLNPVIFNGGSFTYALRNETLGGTVDQWVLTPTAVPSAPDTWWKGDLTGIAAGVWSATLTAGTGAPSNWDTTMTGGIDALVPPDQDSIVHFSATGAANLATTLGANMTIQELIFHTGNAATTIGSSNGVNTLTLGNTVDSTGITLQTGAGNVAISAIVALAQDQSWNIEDSARVLTLSGGLTGTARALTVNDTAANSGTLLFSGAAGTISGTLNQNAGTLAFEGTGSLNSDLNVVLGTASKAATLQVGNTTAATGAVMGGLSNGTFAGSRVIGGNAAISTLTLGSTSGTHSFTGAVGGAGTNENNFNLVKAGAGTQILNGAITYAGTTVVRAGTLQLGAASTFAPTGTLSILADPGATAVFDNFGRSFTTVGVTTLGGNGSGSIAQWIDTAGTKGTITLGGNVVYDGTFNGGMGTINSNLAFAAARTISVGDSNNAATDLTTTGTIAGTGNVALTFDGLGSLAVNGNITNSGGTGAGVNFSGPGTRDINAVITNSGTLNVTGGVLNANVANALDADLNVVVTGSGAQGSAVVNINTTGQVQTIPSSSGGIYIRNGALVNVTQSGGIGTGSSRLYIGDTASASAAAAAVLNLDNANISVGGTGLLVGNSTNIGNITGTGIITTTGNKDLRTGSIAAGITLAGNGAIIKQTTGTLTFFGERDNASTGATTIQEGNLILDYGTNNNSKIGGALNLGTIGNISNGTLTLNGSGTAATTQGVASTAVRAGNTNVVINHGIGQTATLNLGAISRTVANGAGAISFEYSSNDSGATSTSPAGTLGFATLTIGAGPERLAGIDGSGNIVQVAQTIQNAAANWANGQDIINNGLYTGMIACGDIASLTFAHAGASTVSIATGGYLGISSGGILVDASVGAFNSTITGGSLFGATNSGIAGEIIVHQNNTLGTLTIASDITNTGGITKAGLGTLFLSGNNSFLRGSQVTVNEGVLRLGNSSAIGNTTALLTRLGSTFDVNGNNVTVGNLVNGSGGTIALGTGGAITFNQTTNSTYAGVFTGGATSLITVNGGTFNVNFTGATTTGFTGALVVNSGLFQLSSGGRIANANAITINKNGTLLLDNHSTTTNGDRILNTAPITLNSADGAWSGTTQPRGLSIRRDQGSTLDEAVGVITFNSGASYASLEATVANANSDLIAGNFVRSNGATLNVRGTNLGSTLAQNNQLRIGDAANQTSFLNAMIGGGGAAGTQAISIVPWAIGETTTGGVAVTTMGNSLVTYVSGAGFRPLNFTTEYDTYTLAAATDNVRENLAANLTTLAGKTVNSLVINRNVVGAGTTNVTGTGAGQALTNTSGAFLFTLIPTATASAAHNIIVGGFDDGIQVGASNEYLFHVVNPSSATTTATLTARIDSPLNTIAASLTKSGRGTLELNTVNTYSGGTTINEGRLLIHDNDNLGAGGITLAGGSLTLAADYADDLGSLTTPTVNILSGGGTIEVLATSVTATDLALSGSGPLTKIGNGTLQLAGGVASTYTGDFNVRRGLLELNKTAGVDAIGGGNLLIGFSSTANEAATVRLLADNQINDATNVTVRSVAAGAAGTFDLNGHAETIGSLTMSAITGSGALVRTGAGGVLTLNGNITLSNDRNTNDTGTTARGVLITGTGTVGVAAPNSGTLDLGGGNRTITVEPNNLTVATTVGRPDATIETVIRNGAITKEGSRVLFLSANNTYAGSTTINNGTISISSSANLGDGSATNTLAINNGGILQNTGANVDLGVTRAVSLGGSAAFLESTGSNVLTISGIISGTDCAALTVMGTGTVVLSGTNTYLGSTNILAGTLSISSEENLGTNPLIPNAAQLSINGGRLLTTADVILDDTNRGISVGAGNGTIETAAATTLTVENDLALAGNLTKAGPGRLILNGTTTGAGTFTASAGILQFGTRASLYNNTPASWTAANITANTGATVAFNVGGTNELTAGNVTTLLTNLSTVNNNGLQSGSSIGFDTGNASGGNFTIADTITNSTGTGGGAVGVTKLGANTLTLSADNTYTSATNVDAGMLMINGDQSAATGAVTVASGATLGGSGTIGGIASTATIASGGTLTGGNDGSSMTVGVLDPFVTDAVGTLSFGGDLTAATGSIWLVDLVQGVSGTSDLINVGGALGIGGANLAINFGGAFVEHQVYTIANYGTGLTGTFGTLAEGAFVDPGNLYRISYGTGIGSGAITLTAVPEPGTLGFLGLALAGFLTRRIRKRRAAVAQVAAASQE